MRSPRLPGVVALATVSLLIMTGTAQADPGEASAGPSLAVQVAKLTGAASINETDTRYQVMATDLGAMWDNGKGQVLMAFGDTYG